jgi:hypothetical protein
VSDGTMNDVLCDKVLRWDEADRALRDQLELCQQARRAYRAAAFELLDAAVFAGADAAAAFERLFGDGEEDWS